MNPSVEVTAPRYVPGRLRVLVVDSAADEPGPTLAALLESHPGMTVIEDPNALADPSTLMDLHLDVAILHLAPGEPSESAAGQAPSVEVCREIRRANPDLRVLIVASEVDEDMLFAAIGAGASGYLRREFAPTTLREAVVTIASGGSVLDPLMTTAVFERLRDDTLHPADDAFATLSPQEERILDMIAEGMTNNEIAVSLSLSQKTIKNYASQIYAKLNVERRSQAARLATERRMLRER